MVDRVKVQVANRRQRSVSISECIHFSQKPYCVAIYGSCGSYADRGYYCHLRQTASGGKESVAKRRRDSNLVEERINSNETQIRTPSRFGRRPCPRKFNVKRTLQLFSPDILHRGRSMSVKQICRFLDDFRQLCVPSKAPRKLISLRIPTPLLEKDKNK